MKTLLLTSLFVILLAFPLLGNTEAESAFAEGNAAFAREDYGAAIEAYRTALIYGSSPDLHYNLGTAYAHREDWGRASLHLLKTLALQPNHADARANLALVRKRSELGWEERGPVERAATLLSLRTWAWVATGAFWLFVLLWLIRGPISSLSNLLARVFLLGLFVLSAAAMTFYHFTAQRGVVLETVALRVAPTANSPLASEVTAGLQGEVRKEVNGYYLVRTENGDEGYLSPDEFARVWEF